MKYNFLMILFLANLHADDIVNTTNDLQLVNLDPAKDFFIKKIMLMHILILIIYFLITLKILK